MKKCDFCGLEYDPDDVDFEPVHIGDLPRPEPTTAQQVEKKSAHRGESFGTERAFHVAGWRCLRALSCCDVEKKPFVERFDPSSQMPISDKRSENLVDVPLRSEEIKDAVATHLEITHPRPEPDPDMHICEHCIDAF